MNLVIEELRKTQRYHLRQLEENINKIKFHEEAMQTLNNGIEQHRESLIQIGEALEILEKSIAATMPIGKDSTDSIQEVE